MKFLLRSIEKFFPSTNIIIYGDEPSFVNLKTILHYPLSLKKEDNFSVHAKTSSEALHRFNKFFFIVNGVVFLRKIGKLSKYKTPAMRQYNAPEDIRKYIYDAIPFTMHTFNFLSKNTYFTYPFIPCLCDDEKIQPYRKKYSEIYTEFFNLPNALINILPSNNIKVYQNINSFAIQINSFTQISLNTKKSLIYIPNNLAADSIIQYYLESIFNEKSRWEK